MEPRRRKFHKPITMTIPVPPPSGEGVTNGYKGDTTPSLRLLCSITGERKACSLQRVLRLRASALALVTVQLVLSSKGTPVCLDQQRSDQFCCWLRPFGRFPLIPWALNVVSGHWKRALPTGIKQCFVVSQYEWILPWQLDAVVSNSSLQN